MQDKIIKLLSSDNIEDIKIGWELLTQMEPQPKGEEWYEYADILSGWYSGEKGEFTRQCLYTIFGKNYQNNPLWIKWLPK